MRENKTELIEFNKNGYFKKKNFFSKKIIKNLKDEIINLKDVNVFFDKKNQLRRIEKLYDKSSSLREINAKILKYISQLFKKDFVIFKDKLNSKPKGGDGFEPHYDGIFKFKKPRPPSSMTSVNLARMPYNLSRSMRGAFQFLGDFFSESVHNFVLLYIKLR